MKINISVFFSLLFLLAYSSIGAQNNAEITTKELSEEIHFLASDSLKGRKPGMPEEQVAARYIRDKFRAAGLELMGNQGFQEFQLVADVKAGDQNSFKFNGTKAVFDTDFTPLSFSASKSLSANAVFACYGFDIDQDSLKWNDYTGIDAKGKWVFILRGDPEMEKSGSAFIPFEQERSKVLSAKDKGAIGVIFISPSELEAKDKLMTLQYDKTAGDAGMPVFHITRSLADKIIASSGKTIDQIEKACKQDKKPVSFDLSAIIEARADIILQKVTTQNVVGLLRGNDARLNNEFVIVGGHYDHLGFGGPGSGSRMPDTVAVHHGADDNASGTAGVIELAQKIASHRADLKRNVVFVAFTAEEMGLLGSKEFIREPLFDMKKVSAMINLDMIGRMNPDEKSVTIGGTGTSSQSDSLLTALTPNRAFDIKRSTEGYGPSDHASFYSENIPVFFFFTGVHEDYHTPLDVADKINYEGEKDVLDFVYDLTMAIDKMPVQLTFKEAGAKTEARYSRNFKVTLGIIPDMASSENNGLGVDGVRKGGPAELAGIKKGDRIIAIDGQTVTNIYDYMTRLGKLKLGQVASVEVMRNGSKVIILVQL
ncbi:MAG: M20/M25/M40 family metallo-hydrolase [Bacteroidota bacterium]